jgi:hydroxyethylthiazole kinase-like uncharacterized protein yjeF
MEVAGAGLADGIAREAAAAQLTQGAQIELWIGPGNNGGDGLVAYRHLQEMGFSLAIWAPLGLPESGDGAAALEQLTASGLTLHSVADSFTSNPDLIVDCLFGTGLARSLGGAVEEAARRSHNCEARIVACDIPSGLCADTGRVVGTAIKADRCVTFGGLKPGFFCADGLDHCGKITLVTLGYRQDHLQQVTASAWLDLRPARAFLPPGSRAAHKGRFGGVMALAGSGGMEGAALLTVLGARCGGAGLLHLWSPGLERSTMIGMPAEVMFAPFAKHALSSAKRCQAVVAGPGLGRSAESRQALLSLLEAAPEAQWILDADALWHLAQDPFDLPKRCLLTPHEGEAQRLVGEDPLTGSWGGDRLQLVEQIADQTKAVVLLKGAGNLLRAGGVTHLIPGSARALARGGSGDLLAGMIAALAARGLDLPAAAHLAVRLQLGAAELLGQGASETASQAVLAGALAQSWQDLHDS